MSRSIYIAAGIVAVLILYFGVRSAFRGDEASASRAAAEASVPTLEKPVESDRAPRDGVRVVVRRSTAQIRPLFLSIKGRTEAARVVTVRSETTGVVVDAPANEGRAVAQGDVVCALDVEGRVARLREAEAAVASRRLDHNAASDLAEKGWNSPNQAAAAKAQLDAAEAALQVARIELDKTKIRAPFDGVFETRNAEIGDFLSPGGACGVVVELDPILATADAAEQYADVLKVDTPALAKFAGGDNVEGVVRFVARTADPLTRTYRVEVALDNSERRLPAGRTVDIQLQTGEGPAHKVTPALLTLNDEGRLGVRYLDVGSVVRFAEANVLDDDQDGVWISGLPDDVLLLVEGQDYVREGLTAEPVYQGDAS